MAQIHLDPDKWTFDSHCECKGTPGLIYTYNENPDIRLKVQPALRRFSLYTETTGVYDQPLTMLQTILVNNGLV